MEVVVGSRDAPIILDDDEDDDVVFVAGPSRLPRKPSGPTSCSLEHKFMDLPTLSVLDEKNDCMTVVEDTPQSLPVVADMPPPSNLDGEPSTSSSYLKTDFPMHSHSLKRKRSPESEGFERQVLPRLPPLPPSCVIPVPPDPFAGLTKKQRKKLRKRMRAEAEAKSRVATPNLAQATPQPAPPPAALVSSTYLSAHEPVPPRQTSDETIIASPPPRNAGPERATYRDLKWPRHVTKGSKAPIPGPGLGPLSYGGPVPNMLLQPGGIRHPLPPKPGSGMPPNAFGAGVIGRHATTGPHCGAFPASQDQDALHNPACTLVLEKIPKRFRTLDFVLQWCRDVSLESDPAPLYVDVIRKLDKALVEFTSPEQAERAFNSPRLVNEDGRTQIRAFWFRPGSFGSATSALAASSSQLPDHASSPAPVPTLAEHNPQPILSRSDQTHSLPTHPESVGVFSFTPYSRPIHYSFAAISNLPQLPNWKDGERKDVTDSELEEGEVEEIMKPDVCLERVKGMGDFTPQPSLQESVVPVDSEGHAREPSSSPTGQTIGALQNEVKLQEQGWFTRPTSERDDSNALIISSIPTPSSSSQVVAVYLNEDDEDTLFDREESPQLMYPFPEESDSHLPVADAFPAMLGCTSPSTVPSGVGGDNVASESFIPMCTNNPQTALEPLLPSVNHPTTAPTICKREVATGSCEDDDLQPLERESQSQKTKASKEKRLQRNRAYMARIKSLPKLESDETEAMDVDMLLSLSTLADVVMSEEVQALPLPGQIPNIAHKTEVGEGSGITFMVAASTTTKAMTDENDPSMSSSPMRDDRKKDTGANSRGTDFESSPTITSPKAPLTFFVRTDESVKVACATCGPAETYNGAEASPPDADLSEPSESNPSKRLEAQLLHALPSPLPQSTSEHRLAELRERVVASKKQKMKASAAIASSAVNTKSVPVTSAAGNSTESDRSEVSSTESSSSHVSTDSSYSSAESLLSTPISVSSSSGDALPRSASYFDNMASVFLEGILGPLISNTPSNSDTESVDRSMDFAIKDPRILLQKKQCRLEEHLAKSKALFARWEVVKEKSEKRRIMTLIKEEKRAFESENIALDAEIKQVEAAKGNIVRPRSTMVNKRQPFIRWPQTRLDQLVISLSDSEDNDSAAEIGE